MSRAKIIADRDLEVSFLLACFVVWPRHPASQPHYGALWIDRTSSGILFIMRNYLKRPADGGWRVLPNGCDICGRNYFKSLCLCVCLSVCLYLTCLYWRSGPVPIKHHSIKTLDMEVQLHIFLALALDWRWVTCYRLSCEEKPWETLRIERSRQVGEIFVFRCSGFKSRSCGQLSSLLFYLLLERYYRVGHDRLLSSHI
jgi:hypothetical protein